MPSIQFINWPAEPESSGSYPDLKRRIEIRAIETARLVRNFSGLAASPLMQDLVDRILENKGSVMIPATNLSQAEEMVSGFSMLGAHIRLREMDNACMCTTCNRFTVIEIGEATDGIKVFCCAACFELLHLCNWCEGQGWLRKYEAERATWYTCDECCSTRNSSLQKISYNEIDAATWEIAKQVRVQL